jgi:menaquinone reductase, molybdopterin-binding-like subunit
MADIGRRGFLGGAGLLAGVAAGCRPIRDPYAAVKPPVPVERGLRPGSEKYVFTTCGLCPAACGLRVRVVDGRAVKVEGNADSPVNRGGVCARGQAGLEMLYHPDRIHGPRRRVGARGENQWKTISWDEAIAQLVFELGKLRAAGEPQSLVLIDGEQAGTTHALWARFLEVFGSPNHIGHGATGFGAMAQAVRRMTRKVCLPGHDFERARCVLLVGTGALESSPQFIHLARALGGGGRPRLLCASPRLPSSAVLVDEWLSLAPSGSAPLLLGLLHVLLREQLGDESVLEWASGFAPWTDRDGTPQPGLRAQVMAGFTPEKVEALSGVPASRIERLARELVANRPSLVAVDEGQCDPATASAALLVNALLGSINVPGGMLLDVGVDMSDLGRVDPDSIALSGLRVPPVDGRDPGQRDVHSSRILALPQAFISGKPYPAKVLLLSYSNPAFSKAGGQRWLEAIAKVPFVVSFSPVLDESALFADLLLPDSTFFERWDIVEPGRGAGVLSIRQPVVRPLADTLQTGEVVLRLARALGSNIAKAFPWTDYRQAVLARLGKIEGGAEAVLGGLESKGVWSPRDAEGSPERADGRDTRSDTRSIDGQARPVLFDVRGSVAPISAPAAGDPVRFPFVLVPFRGPGYAEGGMRQLDWLRELPLRAGDPWPECLELSQEDARRLGIENGDRVLVESPVAQVELQAEVRAGIRPGVLGLPLGAGPGPARDAAPRASSLLAPLVDAASGHWLACATRAVVRKLA